MILYRNKKGIEETIFDGNAEDFFNYIGQYFAKYIVPSYKGPWPPTDASVKEYAEQNPGYWQVIAEHKQHLRDFVKNRRLKSEKEWKEKMSKMGNLFLAMQEDALKMDKETYLEEYKDWIADAHNIWDRIHGPEGKLPHPDIVTSVVTGKERENR